MNTLKYLVQEQESASEERKVINAEQFNKILRNPVTDHKSLHGFAPPTLHPGFL